jgi:cytidyltransferase-like protein
MKTLIIASGYFNPLHIGHIEYLNLAKSLGDELFVIVNNDLQRELKGSKFFFNEIERECIILNLKSVDFTIISLDTDRSVVKTIEFIFTRFKSSHKIVFVNGGDQFFDNSPEKAICDKLGISLIDGLGKKIQSSSQILKRISG